jgi:hypothetical protein
MGSANLLPFHGLRLGKLGISRTYPSERSKADNAIMCHVEELIRSVVKLAMMALAGEYLPNRNTSDNRLIQNDSAAA